MSVVALASKTLFYEWRKFLPAALAVAFSGLLLLMQAFAARPAPESPEGVAVAAASNLSHHD